MAYSILVRVLLRCHEKDSLLATAIGSDFKGWLSLGLYTVAIPLAFLSPIASALIYASVAVTWLIPDRRIENLLANSP